MKGTSQSGRKEKGGAEHALLDLLLLLGVIVVLGLPERWKGEKGQWEGERVRE